MKMQFTFNLMMKHSLSIGPDEAVTAQILDDFHTFMKGFVSLPIYFPGTAYHKAVKVATLRETIILFVFNLFVTCAMDWFLQARGRIASTVQRITEERKKEKRLQNGDFLDMILAKENLSDEEKVSLIMDLLLGGYETTATLLALLIYFLAQSPQILQQLRVLILPSPNPTSTNT